MIFYKIYKVLDYLNTKHTDHNAFISDDFDKILSELQFDNSYHLLLDKNVKYKLFFDLDNVLNDDQFQQFLRYLQARYDIDINYIAYTKSINQKNLLSYHLVLPSFISYLHNMRELVSNIKKDNYYHEYFYDILDESVYANNRWFRLPNQTNKNKHNTHNIVKGQIKDFVFDYFDNDSIYENDQLYVNTTNAENNTTINNTISKYNIKKIKYSDIVFQTKFNYPIDDHIIKQCLDKLDDNYLEHYNDWIKVTNVLKNFDKKQLWDDWSKNGSSYNYHKNLKYWNSQKNYFSLEWLLKISESNINNIKKTYIPMTNQIFNLKYMNNFRVFDQKYHHEQFTYNDYVNNKFIIIQSTTGTGKTKSVAIHSSKYLKDNPQYRILSIIDRVIIANQHIKTFSEHDINMVSYDKSQFKVTNYIVCINSLLKVVDLYDNNEIQNYIVYIDEIDSFLNFTHNQILDKNMKQIYSLLMYILKNCHKIIVSDAIISDNVVNLFYSILDNKSDIKSIFINNSFKKYNNIPAIRINDENVFIDTIKQHIKDNNYFLFLSDSATIINKLYHECFIEDKKDNFFIYIDSNKTEIIKDASKQLLNKFVFASPSIERGLDFSIDNPQDVFIYVSGKSINSQGIFQQTTRTRNINKLYYYGVTTNYRAKYDTPYDVIDRYINNIEQNNILNNLCTSINEHDEIKFVNNTFFKLFCYNEYKNDTLNTNLIAHYEQQLIDNGFILRSEGENKKLNIEIKNNINNKIIIINNQLFDDFINNKDVRCKQIYNKLHERINLLRLPFNKPDILIKYREQLTDPYKLLKHYNIIRFFKDENYLNEKIKLALNDNFECKLLENIYNKIKLIKTIQKKYNIIDFKINNDFDNNRLTKDEYALIKNTFRITRNIPTNNNELILMYVTMIKNICGPEIIISTRIQNENERKIIYKYNNEHINFHNDLASYYKKNIISDIFDDSDNNMVNDKIKLKKLKFDLNDLMSYIEDGKKFINNKLFI